MGKRILIVAAVLLATLSHATAQVLDSSAISTPVVGWLPPNNAGYANSAGDSALLGGKPESALSVAAAVNAQNSGLLGGKPEAALNVATANTSNYSTSSGYASSANYANGANYSNSSGYSGSSGYANSANYANTAGYAYSAPSGGPVGGTGSFGLIYDDGSTVYQGSYNVYDVNQYQCLVLAGGGVGNALPVGFYVGKGVDAYSIAAGTGYGVTYASGGC